MGDKLCFHYITHESQGRYFSFLATKALGLGEGGWIFGIFAANYLVFHQFQKVWCSHPHIRTQRNYKTTKTRWWFQIFCIFTPYLGKITILTNIFNWVETTNQKITRQKGSMFWSSWSNYNSENQKMAPENQFGEIFPFWNFGPLKGGTCWIFLRVFQKRKTWNSNMLRTHHLWSFSLVWQVQLLGDFAGNQGILKDVYSTYSIPCG